MGSLSTSHFVARGPQILVTSQFLFSTLLQLKSFKHTAENVREQISTEKRALLMCTTSHAKSGAAVLPAALVLVQVLLCDSSPQGKGEVLGF